MVALEARTAAARHRAVARQMAFTVAVVASTGTQSRSTSWTGDALLRQGAVASAVTRLVAVVAHSRTSTLSATHGAVTGQVSGLIAVVAHTG